MLEADMAVLTDAVEATALVVVGGITAAAAIKVGPQLARWGYNKVIGWFR